MTSNSLPTVNEIVSSLKRSFIPTILIEGSDVLFIYRWLKKNLNTSILSLQPCGGRKKLFSIYDRKDEFLDKNVIFIADKDSYRFEEIPVNRGGIIFTSGYCIENDIFEGSAIYHFVDDEDKAQHDLLRKIIGGWFAFELKKYKGQPKNEASLDVATHINVVSPIGLNKICPVFSAKINYSKPCDDEIAAITAEYNLNIRGKQLFQMLSRFLSKKKRFSTFSDKNLIEIALKQGGNHLVDKLILAINNELEAA